MSRSFLAIANTAARRSELNCCAGGRTQRGPCCRRWRWRSRCSACGSGWNFCIFNSERAGSTTRARMDRHAANVFLVQTEAAPHQAQPGQKQEAEHDVAEIVVAQRVIGPRAEPGAEYRRRHR